MPRQKIEAFEWTCDNCGSRHYEIADEPPNGISIQWFEVHNSGGTGGAFWACKPSCATAALRKRHEIEREQEEVARRG